MRPLVAMLLLPFLLALPFLLYECRLRTDINVWRFAQLYESEVKHPEGTQRVLFHSGIHRENGDHCDPEVFEVRSYKKGEENRIARFYYHYGSLALSDNYSRSLGVYFPSRYKEFYWEKENQQRLLEAEAMTRDPVYVVTITSDGPDEVPPFVDFRCT